MKQLKKRDGKVHAKDPKTSMGREKQKPQKGSAAGHQPRLPRAHPAPTRLPHLLQNLAQKVLKAKRDVPIPIFIILLENIRHPLERNTSLHKQVKAHDALPPLIIRPEQQLHEPGREAVPEGDEGVCELLERDVAGAVDVEAVEEGAPGGEEGPEAAELLEGDGAGAVRVEHADHHPDGLRVEGGPVAVYEGGA